MNQTYYERARATRFQAVSNYNLHIQACASCRAAEADDSFNTPLCGVGDLALSAVHLADAAVDREALSQDADEDQARWEESKHSPVWVAA